MKRRLLNKFGYIIWGYGVALILGAGLIRAGWMTPMQVTYLGIVLTVGGCILNFITRD